MEKINQTIVEIDDLERATAHKLEFKVQYVLALTYVDIPVMKKEFFRAIKETEVDTMFRTLADSVKIITTVQDMISPKEGIHTPLQDAVEQIN